MIYLTLYFNFNSDYIYVSVYCQALLKAENISHNPKWNIFI